MTGCRNSKRRRKNGKKVPKRVESRQRRLTKVMSAKEPRSEKRGRRNLASQTDSVKLERKTKNIKKDSKRVAKSPRMREGLAEEKPGDASKLLRAKK